MCQASAMRATVVAARALLLVALLPCSRAAAARRSRTCSAPTPAQARAELAGSPAALAALHEQAAQLLDGGLRRLRRAPRDAAAGGRSS